MLIKNILCPTDFSTDSRDALVFATSFAKDHDAELHIVHVYQEPFAYVDGDLPGIVPPADMEPMRQRLATIAPADSAVRFRRAFIIGDPTHEIVAYAKREQVDLIVMGTHGWTGLSRLLMGSVAEAVVRRASCPVVTIRQPAPKLEESA